eukprot:NODE_2212_length_1652_cov_2733.040549_g1895_i0.p1 GENE.NODE_2212_length_1652_cov_2733.040549_g1895_i0~~NODE_2212_length_1652_cov_2733.040549_g1895_i0.p1  ORF type:complete len:478 (-),score=114.96 NODE_2212_length_1652_cov_2733.040549_g1895_i0:109-1542(-)
MSARPTVTVQKTKTTVPLPNVFTSPLRYDVVQFAHNAMRKNARHPYAVSRRAGHQTSAESWGTGRAVARIPRVSGGGTSRSGQGAFGNMCRGGRMFAPTKVFRKWTAKANVKVKRLAVKAALAASAIPALVLARGHDIARVPEIPLVVPDNVELLEKTKDAVKFLKDVGVYQDLERVKKSQHIRAGIGKIRNRRYVKKKGPLLVFTKKCPAIGAFRALPGVDISFVSALNLLKLAPGGTFGRLIVFSEGAFKQLDKKLHARKYTLPDSKRVINSAEVQAVVRARKPVPRKQKARPNPNLNPAAKLVNVQVRNEIKRKHQIQGADWSHKLQRNIKERTRVAKLKLRAKLINNAEKRKAAEERIATALKKKAKSKKTKQLGRKYSKIQRMVRRALIRKSKGKKSRHEKPKKKVTAVKKEGEKKKPGKPGDRFRNKDKVKAKLDAKKADRTTYKKKVVQKPKPKKVKISKRKSQTKKTKA